MKRRLTTAIMCAGLAGIVLGQFGAPPALIWNRTESVPRGLYVLSPPEAPLKRGELVAYQPTESEAQWLEGLGALGPGWPMIKRVAALGGDEVCVHAGRLLINGLPTANLLQMDHEGRELPRPAGCRRIGSEEVLLLGDHPKSLDGRYFSAQERGRIIGKASAIWKTGASSDP